MEDMFEVPGDRLRELSDAARSNRLKTGAGMVVDERIRQILEEKFTADHDDGYVRQELPRAALCYAMPTELREHLNHGRSRGHDEPPEFWPWSEAWWKPGEDTVEGRLRELVKAGALIVAEIDRILRSEQRRGHENVEA